MRSPDSALRVNRKLTDHLDAQVEVRHTWADAVQHRGPTRSVQINFSDGLSLAAGLSYRF